MPRSNECPACGKFLRGFQCWGFSTFYGTRRVRPCPHCGERLRLTRDPFVIISVLCPLLILITLASIADIIPRVVLAFLAIPICIAVFIAALALRLEVARPNSQQPHQ
jgi:hypothetical protein